jgi:predicted Zn-dependent protease
VDSESPLTLAETLGRIEALVERRRFVQARPLIKQGLQQFPDSAQLMYFAAFVDYASNDHEAAMELTQTLLGKHPQHYGGRTLAAHLHEDLKQYSDAERLWIDLLKEYPEDPDALGHYAMLMLRTLHAEKAIRLAQEGLRIDPQHNGCLFVMALSETITGGGSSANLHLETLVREHPERMSAMSALIVALADRGELQPALRVAQEMLRADPNDPHILEMVRDLKAQTHWSMKPLYPMQRWGWGGAIGVTVAGIVGLRVLDGRIPDGLMQTLSTVWLVYVIYSWVWPSMMKRFV